VHTDFVYVVCVCVVRVTDCFYVVCVCVVRVVCMRCTMLIELDDDPG